MTQYQSYRYDELYFCPSISPTDSTQSTTVPAPLLLIRYSLLLPQYKSYWYDTFYYCPSASSTDTTQYTTVPYSYWYYTFHYYRSTSLTYMTQSSSSLTDTTQPTSVPVLLLLIWYSLPLPTVGDWYDSPRLSQNESCWYDTVHYCPSTRPIGYDSSLLPNTSPTDTLQCATATAQDQSYFCPSTSPADMICSPLLSQYQSSWYDSPLLPQPQINWYDSPLLPNYQSNWYPSVPQFQSCPLLPQNYWYDSVHYCPSINLPLCYSTLLPQSY